MQPTKKFLPIGDFYEISNRGLIFSIQRTVICKNGQVRVKKRCQMKTHCDKDGYVLVCLYFNGIQVHCRVHRLVGIVYIPNPDNKPFINHKRGNKKNNYYKNLEWCTHEENERHAIKYLGKKQPKGKTSKLSTKMIVTFPNGQEKIMYGQNETARKLGLSQANIWRVLEGYYQQTGGYKFRYAA